MWLSRFPESHFQPREATHRHARGEVLALDIAGRNVRDVGSLAPVVEQAFQNLPDDPAFREGHG